MQFTHVVQICFSVSENAWGRLLANLPSASFSDFEDNRLVARVDLEEFSRWICVTQVETRCGDSPRNGRKL